MQPSTASLATIWVFLALPVHGQTAAAPAAAREASATSELSALRVIPRHISESRTSDRSGMISLSLSIEGAGLPAIAVVRAVTVTKAVDDKDRSMLSTKIRQSKLASTSILSLWNLIQVGPKHIGGFVHLESSVRSATSIKYAEGTIELYMPSESTNAIVRIPNVMSHSGLVEHPTLTKHGIKYYFYADQAAYDATREIYPRINNSPAPLFPTQVGFYQIDPSSLVIGFELQDPVGNRIQMQGTAGSGTGSGRVENIRLAAPAPKDTQMVLFLDVPEAIKTVPFRVEDIPLP